MTPRLQSELELVKKYYKNVEVNEESNREVLQIIQYPLPAGWDKDFIDLRIIIPQGYPITPPDNFYVKPNLRTSAGNLPNNYQDDGTGQGMPSWSWFSFHMSDDSGQATWFPTNDPSKGDNLVSYIRAINDRLKEAN